jgi:hypothetical protein
MTRKHYIKLAELIKDNGRMASVRNNPMFVIDKHEFMNGLCDFFKQENLNFDEIKFRQATGEITGM